MNPSAWTHERLMIPRWRSLAATLQSNELSSIRAPRAGDQGETLSTALARRLGRWRHDPSLVTAAELVEAALVAGREREAVDAARQLVNVNETAAPLIRAQAQTLLRRVGLTEDVPAPQEPRAADWRRLTRLHPQNALAWVELAFHQTVHGHPEAAAKSMAAALHLARDNRHVLRSAARLYLHLEDRERAHDLIAKSPVTRTDPWLLSAEIAFARAAHRQPRFLKLGVNLVEDGGLMPSQITELAGSVGTVDLLDGSRRRARKMFVRSMEDPNGNALAQAEWATPRIGAEIVPTAHLESVHEAFEAMAFHRYREHRFSEVPAICERWAEVDPYSVRPFEFGASAAGLAEDYAKAEELARRGLELRPKSQLLMNYRAFALSHIGRGPEADALLASVIPASSDDALAMLTLANQGLSAFRQGRHEEGMIYYRRAIDGFRRIGHTRLSACARAYLAREASRAGLPEALKLQNEAVKAMEPYKDSEALRILHRVIENDGAGEPIEVPSDAATREAKLQRLRTISWTTPGWSGFRDS